MLKNIKPQDGQVYVVTDTKQRFYFTGFKSTFGYLLITEKENVFFTDLRYLSGAKEKLKGTDVVVKEAKGGFKEAEEFIKKGGYTELGIDYTLTTMTEFATFNALGLKVFDISKNIQNAMGVKTKQELEIIKESCKIAQESFYEVIKILHNGITEKQVATEFEYIMKKKGAETVSFDLIVAFGKNAACPHHETDDTKLEENQVVLMDFGCIYKGYCSDMTRTFWYGDKIDEKFKEDYENVLNSAKCAEKGIRNGMTGIVADAFARDYLGKKGIAQYFTHSLGHGIGVNIHEFPRLSVKAENILENNMVFSIEPGIYIDGVYGIRIEDTVALIDGKVERFMTDDKSLFSVKAKV